MREEICRWVDNGHGPMIIIIMAKHSKRTSTMTEMLREALANAESVRAVARETGVQQASLVRFLKGGQSLRLDVADKLATFFNIECTGVQQCQAERYRVTDLSICQNPDTANLLHLMDAFEALRSAYRWMFNTARDSDPIAGSDRIMAVISSAGWAWGAKELLGRGRKKGWLTTSLLPNNKHRRVFAEVTSKRLSPRLKAIEEIRNKCFGHFDPRIAQAFLARPEEEIPPFLETTGRGKLLKTRYPWSAFAVAGFFCPTPFQDSEVRKLLREVNNTVRDIMLLLGAFIPALAQQLGMKWKREGDDG